MGESNTPQFLIAAIGASAGGLEACETFFQHMPADDTPIASIGKQHRRQKEANLFLR